MIINNYKYSTKHIENYKLRVVLCLGNNIVDVYTDNDNETQAINVIKDSFKHYKNLKVKSITKRKTDDKITKLLKGLV